MSVLFLACLAASMKHSSRGTCARGIEDRRHEEMISLLCFVEHLCRRRCRSNCTAESHVWVLRDGALRTQGPEEILQRLHIPKLAAQAIQRQVALASESPGGDWAGAPAPKEAHYHKVVRKHLLAEIAGGDGPQRGRAAEITPVTWAR